MTQPRNYDIADIEVTELTMVIDGECCGAAGGKTRTRLSPAHGVPVTTLPAGDATDVDRAIKAARRSLDDGWRTLAGAQRAALLHRVGELIRRDHEQLSLLESLEAGKPLQQARGEVSDTAALWEYAATLARHNQGEAHNGLGADAFAMVLHEPLGVIGMITPWNFPLLIVSQKLPFALAAGNTAVIKPSESTSATTVRLAELVLEAGIPAGVVNVVTGDRRVGQAIVEHAGIDMLSFTGSTGVGKNLAATAGQNLKKVELELGGKNPQIVTENADWHAAVDAAVFGGYFNVGQCCNSGSRIIVHRSIADEFAQAVAARAAQVKLGDPLDSETQIGAIVSDAQLETIEHYVREGIAGGATLITGGGQIETAGGRFFQPTIFGGVTRDMTIANEEIFGPVLSVMPYDTLEEAIEIANSTSFGLSAGIWSRDIDEALIAARDLRAGTVWVNRWMTGYPEIPFGGFAESGIGRELGKQSLAEFSEIKTIQLQVGPNSTRWVPVPDAEGRP
ncbi:MAG: aldehyde dehydrogenase family protein [Leucobacter sp.]